MSIITLTTDFGTKDHFAGALKGKLLSEAGGAMVVDLSHDIDPFNIAEAAYIVGAAYSSFPKGTVHLIAVDYELNKETRHIAMEWDGHFFVCADNGLPGILAQRIVPSKVAVINIHDRLPADATDLDVFVTVASHLSKGGLLNVIGKDTKSLKALNELKPTVADDGNAIRGAVIYIDRFGNAVTNITRQLFMDTAKGRPYDIILNERLRHMRGNNIRTIWPRYSDIASSGKYPLKNYEGEKLAIFNEAGHLEIAIFRSNTTTVGSASSLLGLGYRDPILIEFN
ncbi:MULTISPECIES: S-adenosyl-l-methionine hydroxide adenosyltransferase family protein [unclassified Flavobacterium]|uniref:SAM hydrolase/SAM-dependent halogenase family protein n=1 Tax=unclassified Flavobacterium TaxID=196869 RepID=UPI001F1457B7|nr:MULTISPECIES: SAM-dependent chlorinase/fluorinase [unclassified Flavobacterium]UMY64908.1 SAM-dependent chlorinase/fluorinase [Flavobacterium sp. HJ-32-4]